MSSRPSTEPSGLFAARSRPVVALVGNPNAGKTTLFNALTGSRQKVGNYPGVTVERVSADLRLDDQTVECVDVPGLYSMDPVSEDERVASEAIREEPDLLVCVVDVTNLERNLFFYSQLAGLGYPLIVALSMVDRLRSRGEDVAVDRLSQVLGAEVVPMVGHSAANLKPLREAISRNLVGEVSTPGRIVLPEVEAQIDQLRERMARSGYDPEREEVHRLLLDDPDTFENVPELAEAFQVARDQLQGKLAISHLTVAERYAWASWVQDQVIRKGSAVKRATLTDRIDAVLTHRVFGLAFFVALMYGVFLSIYSFAKPLMDGIEAGFAWLQDVVSPRLEQVPVLQSLIVDGIIGGVGGVLVFLPQILILFFFISVLEGSGYLARAAFLMDRLLGWCGLNGRAFIPLLSSFACAIPGIMAARVMPDARSRLATILVAPLMSCSARLPVYLLLIGAFIQPKYGPFWAGFALFAMHFLGLLVAIPVTWVLNRRVLRGKRLPFLLELPPYQWPRWRDVWLAMYFRGKVFVKTAGTVIFAMSVVIWALSYFPRLDPAETARITRQAGPEMAERRVAEAQLEGSVLGRFGKAIEPVFRPAGFDWRITTSILAAFPARETVVPSLGIIFSLGEGQSEGSKDLSTALSEATWPDGRPLMTVWTATALMAFFALCAQCMATLATVKRETNSWKWAAFMFAYMTVLAYLVAVLINQVGLLVTK